MEANMPQVLEKYIDVDGQELTVSGGNQYKEYLNSTGVLHRLDGPAKIITDEVFSSVFVHEWWQNGKLSRIDGPAIFQSDRSKAKEIYFLDGQRIPSKEEYLTKINGLKYIDKINREELTIKTDVSNLLISFLNSKNEKHRLDGPAFVHLDYYNSYYNYYLNGRKYHQSYINNDVSSKILEEAFNTEVKSIQALSLPYKYTDSDGQTLTIEIDEYKTKYYRNSNNELHRLDGPAVEYKNGSYVWYINGKRHNTKGPARVWVDTGREEYYLDGKELSKEQWEQKVSEYIDSDGQKLRIEVDDTGTIRYYNSNNKQHRLDGPATKYADGTWSWYKEGKHHRIGGPAYFDSKISYYAWIVDGEYHNTEGPARVWKSLGEEEYHLNGIKYSKEQWEQKVLEMKNEYKDSDGQILRVEVDNNGTTKHYNCYDKYHRLDGPAIFRGDGSYSWYRDGEYHRTGGPAIYDAINNMYYWYVDNELHNVDGPAIIYKNSSKEEYYLNGEKYSKEQWEQKVLEMKNEYKDSDGQILTIRNYDNRTEYYNSDGKLHRLDGPAHESIDGDYSWYKDGKCHNTKGPAILRKGTGAIEYWLDDKKLPKEEWEKKVSEMKNEYKDSDGQELKVETDYRGTKRYYNSKNQQHRIDGPATEYKDGSYYWIKNDLYHRVGGPSTYCKKDDYYAWHLNGNLHNTEGPARVWKYTGREEYWLDNNRLTKEEWEQKVLEMKNESSKYIDSDGQILTIEIDDNGTRRYRNSKGLIHRLDGPATEYKDGSYSWRKDGSYHRIGGPSWFNAEQNYYEWRIDGKIHNTEGPVILCKNTGEEWYYLDGKQLSKKEWEQKVLDLKSEYKDSDGQILRIKYYDNKTEYYNPEEQLHRLDGPAVEYKNGSYSWFKNNLRHRIGGPANYSVDDNYLSWWKDGKYHNTEGPARLWKRSGEEEYYLDDNKLSKEEWKQKISEMSLVEQAKSAGYETHNIKLEPEKQDLCGFPINTSQTKHQDHNIKLDWVNKIKTINSDWIASYNPHHLDENAKRYFLEHFKDNSNYFHVDQPEIKTNSETLDNPQPNNYNTTEIERKNSIMSNAMDFIKECSADGIWRSIGDNTTAHTKQLLISVLKGKGADEGTLSFVGSLLDSKEGEIFIATLLAALLHFGPQIPMLPIPDSIKKDKRVARLAKEFGTKASADGITYAYKEASAIMIPLLANLTQQLAALPEPVEQARVLDFAESAEEEVVSKTNRKVVNE